MIPWICNATHDEPFNNQTLGSFHAKIKKQSYCQDNIPCLFIWLTHFEEIKRLRNRYEAELTCSSSTWRTPDDQGISPNKTKCPREIDELSYSEIFTSSSQ